MRARLADLIRWALGIPSPTIGRIRFRDVLFGRPDIDDPVRPRRRHHHPIGPAMTAHQRAGVTQAPGRHTAACTCGATFTGPTPIAAHIAQQLHQAQAPRKAQP